MTGLRRYGQPELAETIAKRWLTLVTNVYANTGKLLEKYNVVTLTPGGGGEYPLQDGFGWTNGVTVGLFRLYPSDACVSAAAEFEEVRHRRSNKVPVTLLHRRTAALRTSPRPCTRS